MLVIYRSLVSPSNEKEMSDGHREQASAAVKASKPLEIRTRGGWLFAPSHG
jgi:hypothetical protein